MASTGILITWSNLSSKGLFVLSFRYCGRSFPRIRFSPSSFQFLHSWHSSTLTFHHKTRSICGWHDILGARQTSTIANNLMQNQINLLQDWLTLWLKPNPQKHSSYFSAILICQGDGPYVIPKSMSTFKELAYNSNPMLDITIHTHLSWKSWKSNLSSWVCSGGLKSSLWWIHILHTNSHLQNLY